MFDIVPGQYQPRRIRTGAIFTVFVAIFLYIIYTKPSIPLLSGGGTAVKADFAYAANIRPGYTPVRVLGVDVGQVTGLKRGPNARGAELTLTIDPGKGVSVRQDATLSLRWRTLLGRNYYVDLTPGSPSAAPLGDQVIPESRTNSQVEIDQALEPLNATGRKALGTMINQFSAGFADPAAVRGTVQNFAPAMKNLAAGLPGLRGTQPGTDLPALISSTNKMMGALARDEVNLGNMIDNGSVALGVTAARSIDLGSTFDQAPGALQQTQATMTRLVQTLNVLDPIAQRLGPGATALAPAATEARTALDAATPLLADARPTLAALRPSVSALSKAATAGAPVITGFMPLLNRIQTSFIPFLNRTDPGTKLKNYEAVGPAVAGVSSTISLGDKNGPLAGFEAGFGENTISSSPCLTFLTDPNVPLQNKVDCQALSQILANILSGQPLTAPLSNSLVPQQMVTKLLHSTTLFGAKSK
jgi:phospholipid/cholesterol/gamma-HCH transport system substrate-binding protein